VLDVDDMMPDSSRRYVVHKVVYAFDIFRRDMYCMKKDSLSLFRMLMQFFFPLGPIS
jgi:hypothetical protein